MLNNEQDSVEEMLKYILPKSKKNKSQAELNFEILSSDFEFKSQQKQDEIINTAIRNIIKQEYSRCVEENINHVTKISDNERFDAAMKLIK